MTTTYDKNGDPQTSENLNTGTRLQPLFLPFLPSQRRSPESPLAENFTIGTGRANITVPNVPTREDYIVVLFGDRCVFASSTFPLPLTLCSGNASPKFKIAGK